VSGNDTSRVFDVTAGTSTLQHLVVTGGHAAGEDGGGIRVAAGASLALADVAVVDNSADGGGGGIRNDGTLTLTDTVVAQKTFFEIYKQYRGEYMGARMTAWLEAMWPFMHHESDITEFTAELMNAGVNNAVKAAEMGYPPEWRMSLSGRRKG